MHLDLYDMTGSATVGIPLQSFTSSFNKQLWNTVDYGCTDWYKWCAGEEVVQPPSPHCSQPE